MVYKHFQLLVYASLFFIPTLLAQPKLVLVDSTSIENPDSLPLSKISFRGVSVVNNEVVWVSGTKGTFAKSIDGGKTFRIAQIPGYDSSDFRDIEAFSKDKAIVMSSGTPGYILKTYDGGLTWKKVFEDHRKEFFLDAMDFWNEDQGMVIGDPIDERFVLYRTIDGGNTWHPMDTSMRPWAIEGESLFAASGTCFRCMPNNSIAFVSGGSKSIFHWLQIDKKYQRFELKNMVQGKASQGAFSFDFDKKHIIIVGGDYASDTSKIKQGFSGYYYSKDGLELMNQKPFYCNYRSSVELLANGNFITCGTKGVDYNNTEQTITTSNAKSQLSNLSFNVVRKAKKGKLVILAGSKGKIARLVE
ncbi:MAG: oxidoreductase [Bacteroidetes bacterium B1(2017)]|nr:MAG: oxidoreductase [Bacteroidetes bacterium B1(2017)]